MMLMPFGGGPPGAIANRFLNHNLNNLRFFGMV
jgi:hypothetical protein